MRCSCKTLMPMALDKRSLVYRRNRGAGARRYQHATAGRCQALDCAGFRTHRAIGDGCGCGLQAVHETFDALQQHLYRNGGQYQSHQTFEGGQAAIAEQAGDAFGGE